MINDVDLRMVYLLIDLKEKYGELINDYILIKLLLLREEMVNYIGVICEIISRKLKKFEDEGLLKIVGIKNIVILDEEGLKDYI